MEAADKSLLIIFYRNPKKGSVKTRLAATVGHEKALGIFMKLATHTRNITQNLRIDKVVCYSESVENNDIWDDGTFRKTVQKGEDLGEKMSHAFASGFKLGYDTICIIGTDCYDLTADIIRQAFTSLRMAHVVIGPAFDGGYYLLGMHKVHRELFADKKWSSETVFADTVADFDRLGLRYVKLSTLRDVDTEADLPPGWGS